MTRQIAVTGQGQTRHIDAEIVPAREQLPRYTDIGPCQVPQLQPRAHLESATRGGHEDRARGFNKVNYPIAATLGVLALIVAYIGGDIPVFSIKALFCFWLVFLAWLVVAYALHLRHTAEGVALREVNLGYKLLREEQKLRFRQWHK